MYILYVHVFEYENSSLLSFCLSNPSRCLFLVTCGWHIQVFIGPPNHDKNLKYTRVRPELRLGFFYCPYGYTARLVILCVTSYTKILLVSTCRSCLSAFGFSRRGTITNNARISVLFRFSKIELPYPNCIRRVRFLCCAVRTVF